MAQFGTKSQVLMGVGCSRFVRDSDGVPSHKSKLKARSPKPLKSTEYAMTQTSCSDEVFFPPKYSPRVPINNFQLLFQGGAPSL